MEESEEFQLIVLILCLTFKYLKFIYFYISVKKDLQISKMLDPS